MAIRHQEGGIRKEPLRLETHVFCKILPENFDHLPSFIGPINHQLLNNDQKRIQMKHKRHKIAQDSKRAWLNVSLNVYEHKTQRFDQP